MRKQDGINFWKYSAINFSVIYDETPVFRNLTLYLG